MTQTIDALQALETAVGALAWATRQLVALIRGVYLAGHASGIAWHRWGRPTLLATIGAITRVWALIDWPTALGVTKDALVVIVASTVAAAQAALPLLVKLSAAIGRRYALLLGVTAPMAAVADLYRLVEAAPMAAVAVAVAGDAPAGKTKGARAPHRRQQLTLGLELPA